MRGRWSALDGALGSCGAQLGPPGLDRAHPLHQPGPGPRLHFAVPRCRLPAGGLEVLEPGIRLLDQQQFLGFALPRHGLLPPGSWMARIVGPASDSTKWAPGGRLDWARWYPGAQASWPRLSPPTASALP